MDNQSKKHRYYTFMLVPHDASGKAFSVKIPERRLYAAVAGTLCVLLFVSGSLIYSTHLSRKLINYGNTMAKNREQKQMIESFSYRTKTVNKAISELVEEDNKLRQMLGLRNWKSKVKLSSDMNNRSADMVLAERKQSYNEMKAWVNDVRAHFAVTPSIWPAYGPIMSYFGYRIFPWRGFHAGVDISTHYGAPVRCTANGIVSSTGWQRGYGRTVVVDHGRGISTLYAHNSSFAVSVGQKVKKGQVISYVGTSGYSTGPHLHYEVQRNGRPVNPTAYLNLNILSASRVMEQ
ncbi:MAG: M23 family metallopeptidase [Candidatus Margulisbacteria bacterium]|nr:M23 family metallopeptidase [Candidatus Margulisiibacteriota bacterium]